MPLVSVVIATYNYAAFLPQAIASVRAQTMSDWECIIVDDASTDNTAEVVAALMQADDRIRYIRNTANLGEAGARNVGNNAARGEYIAVLDGDDWWHPDKLRLQLEAFQQSPRAVLCYAGLIHVSGSEERVLACEESWLENLEIELRKTCVIAHGSVMARRDAIMEVGGYNTGMPYAVDWDLWLRLLSAYGQKGFTCCYAPLLYYRIHGHNMTSRWRRASTGDWIAVRKLLLRNAWGLRHPISAWRVLDAHLDREIHRRRTAGLPRNAFLFGCAKAALAPLRRWRWIDAMKLLNCR